MWDDPVDWEKAFKFPNYYYDNMIGDDEIERNFVYEMPDELSSLFSKSKTIDLKDIYGKE